MCGIVGAVAQRDVAEILVEGLRRLEYRGYDSAGVAVFSANQPLQRVRRLGKVAELAKALDEQSVHGGTGIAHTRWATHGEPSERNAHPHVSEHIVVVHNGIIENHEELREELKALGYVFSSDTDTEVIAHLVHHELKSAGSLLAAMQTAVKQLRGAYGTVVMDSRDDSRVVVARSGSPLVIGRGIGENFIASDQMALLPVTRRFIFLEEGDVAEVTRRDVHIFDTNGNAVAREEQESELSHDAGDKGEYRHYMLKEIHEQPKAITNTLEGRLGSDHVVVESFGNGARAIFDKVEHVQIVACGTSYHSGMVARYWFEEIAGVSCDVEIASEFRYRKSVVRPNSLLVTLSQSGETADTLAALRLAKESGYMSSLAICNVPGSSLVRESDLAFMTRAGAEIGVASTKAFTTQLAGLLMLVASVGHCRGHLSAAAEAELVKALQALPLRIKESLALAKDIETLAEEFADKQHSLFLGRGSQYPIAMEGALKLKEISYIHAEAYAAGELKHGPLALIDAEMPIIVVAPNNDLLEKLKSNVEEVRARGGILYVFADADTGFKSDETMRVMNLNHVEEMIAPIVYTVPLQLLSYHVALIKGTDVDQPRNLAKSVTVE
ncbi:MULTISPECIES: glutamine--fructose-6-phosphate transaminase (isomerizing) [Aeromonas]|jgi:glucosamine--fructose-6-phosphate aminotransferase (isomerizing)|uniref:Glutamine--fructose-6-phosphate aminotransferase [isomerizing] n=1 Tax=Aeromonas veronii TaxID=654 RepID=A0A2T4N2F8_AERVE|nr:glutamine--fructose-6-phosphate transaminase (isomerizing) [Aeromonas veronii]AXV21290.1 glutamine--fructose-6-phosphate transaminase (isomerizing) [Aeromonas veronii]MBA2800784.1 glutamine--fructose-6-phosphate transaminase (isomerizing) [Aeromonas veronii]MCX0443965.1 glutamine--fructose-6-phosphate transaminase (isomerizing) [Aeromonas veronii]PTH80987.1 glutamine--fructose-6-phosphate transaminase (isomerizing) [Aeromonas veronii]RDE60596.1 glutamine--fructose-6-phosphate transaminase (